MVAGAELLTVPFIPAVMGQAFMADEQIATMISKTRVQDTNYTPPSKRVVAFCTAKGLDAAV